MSIHQPVSTFVDDRSRNISVSNRATRTFDLHPALFAVTVGCYLAYLVVMAVTFMNDELVIPFAIFAITIVAGFLVPGLWARVAGPAVGRMQSWADFMSEGIDTYTGHLSGRSAAVQVLIMPVMLVGWGLIIAIIRASV